MGRAYKKTVANGVQILTSELGIKMNSDIFAITDEKGQNAANGGSELEARYRRVVPQIITKDSKEPLHSNKNLHLVSDCLCVSVAPLTKLAQIFGVVPVVNDSDQSHGSQGCLFHFRLVSFPNLTNWLALLLYGFSVVWCYMYYRDTLVDDFQGTDLYAHEFKIDTTVVAGTFIVLGFRLKYGSFVKCVRVLSSVWHTLDGPAMDKEETQSQSSWRSRFATASTLSRIAAALICLNVLQAGLVGTFRFGARYSLLKAPTLYLVQVVALSGLTALQQTVAFVFALLCWITRSLFVKLSEQLKFELSGKHISGHRLEQIRLLHNALCNSNKYLSSYFGLPVLGICCTAVIAITCGIYNFIFSEETLFDGARLEDLSVKKLYYIMFCFEMYFSVLAIGLILVSGQMLSNSVSSCIDAIHQCNLVDLDPKSEFQIMVCLQSIKASSGKLTANNMATIGMGFIASAVTNTTTYILVLLQFRLGGDDAAPEAGAGSNATTAAPI